MGRQKDAVGTPVVRQDRKCDFPGCEEYLSSLVPEEIIYCGSHQSDLREMDSYLRTYLKVKFSEEDMIIILRYSDGCTGFDLAQALEKPYNNIYHAIRKNRIKAEWRTKPARGHWYITRTEMIRVIYMVKHWVPVRQVALDLGLPEKGVLGYARQGLFGPCKMGIFGQWCIKKKNVPFVKEIFLRKKAQNLKHHGRVQVHTLPGEYTVEQLAEMFGTRGLDTVHYWIRSGPLFAEKRDANGNFKTVRSESLIAFCRLIQDKNNFRVAARFRERGLEILGLLEGGG